MIAGEAETLPRDQFMPVIKHTKDSLEATNFATTYPGWHTYRKNSRTIKAVKRAVALGVMVTNEFGQFRSAENPGEEFRSGM